MKKRFSPVRILLLVAAMSAMTGNAFAQSDTLSAAKRRLTEIEALTVKPSKPGKGSDEKILGVDIFSHIAYGKHLVKDDLFSGSFGPSREIEFGAVRLNFRVCDWMSVRTGADVGFNQYSLPKGNMFFEKTSSGGAHVVGTQTLYNITEGGTAPSERKYSSRLNTTALSVPLGLDFHFRAFGKNLAGVRIEAGVSFPIKSWNDVTTSWKEDDTRLRMATRKIKTKDALWYGKAEIYAGAIGFYYKYRPESELPGLDLSHSTLGLSLNF